MHSPQTCTLKLESIGKALTIAHYSKIWSWLKKKPFLLKTDSRTNLMIDNLAKDLKWYQKVFTLTKHKRAQVINNYRTLINRSRNQIFYLYSDVDDCIPMHKVYLNILKVQEVIIYFSIIKSLNQVINPKDLR